MENKKQCRLYSDGKYFVDWVPEELCEVGNVVHKDGLSFEIVCVNVELKKEGNIFKGNKYE